MKIEKVEGQAMARKRKLREAFRGWAGRTGDAQHKAGAAEEEHALEQTLNGAPETQSESAVPETQGVSSAPDFEGRGPVPGTEDAGRLPEWSGALLEVWRRWAPDSPPPVLSLVAGKSVQELHMDAHTLEKECVRLASKLERDAKKRLSSLEQAAENENASLDAACSVYLSRDRMAAWSFLFPPYGPDGKLREEAIAQAMEESGVSAGVDSAAVARALQAPLYYKLVPIAVGTPMVEGQDGSVTEHFPHRVSRGVQMDENGTADYRASSYVQSVEKDTVICDITQSRPGTAGMGVDGKVIEPRPVKAAKVPAGQNTVLTEDGLHLVAARAGHLEYSHGAFHVKEVLEINGDVDYSTGNIDFPGDVHITGDVRDNFTVHAGGTVTVDGLVEGATVEAGGNLVITRGAVGDNRALLKCKGCVRVRYLEGCVVYAGKSVYMDCAMASQIFSDDSIYALSGKGSIIGGELTAAHEIKALAIGAQSGRQTKLTLGVLPYVQHEVQTIREELEKLARDQENLDKELAYLESRPDLEGQAGKLAKTRMRRSVVGMKIQQRLKWQERLNPNPTMTDFSHCRMEAETIYPNTRLTVQGSSWSANSVRKYCKVVYNEKARELKELY